MNNYQSLTPEELNRLLAEFCFGQRYEDEYGHGYWYKDNQHFWEPSHPYGEDQYKMEKGHFEWNPCDPDSNQIERYVFPKLLEKAKYDYENHLKVAQAAEEGWLIELRLQDDSDPTEDDPFSLPSAIWVRLYCKTIEEINITKAIACLMAKDEIDGE